MISYSTVDVAFFLALVFGILDGMDVGPDLTWHALLSSVHVVWFGLVWSGFARGVLLENDR